MCERERAKRREIVWGKRVDRVMTGQDRIGLDWHRGGGVGSERKRGTGLFSVCVCVSVVVDVIAVALVVY